MNRAGICLIGCGNISGAYLKARRDLPVLEAGESRLCPRPCSRAEDFAVLAVELDTLLADRPMEMVLNLTVPEARDPVAMQVLLAGKHPCFEKPPSV